MEPAGEVFCGGQLIRRYDTDRHPLSVRCAARCLSEAKASRRAASRALATGPPRGLSYGRAGGSRGRAVRVRYARTAYVVVGGLGT